MATISPSHWFFIYNPALSLLRRGHVPRPPCAHRRDGAGIGRLRQPHPNPQSRPKEPMLTLTSTRGSWRRYGERGRCPELRSRRWTSSCDDGRVPVSQNTYSVNQLMDRQQRLTPSLPVVVARPETARTNLTMRTR